MPEIRTSPLDGRLVVVAPERAARPDTFRSAGSAPAGLPKECPFCPGNEAMTPPEVARTGSGEPDGPGWRVRVVPNLYPITEAHEVVVFSPDHGRGLARLAVGEIEEILGVMAERSRHHREAGRRYVQMLVNHGKPAGASIEHPHAQLVAVDVDPPAVLAEAAALSGEECVLCRLPDEALTLAGGDVVAWCPPWSSSPFEMLVAPRRHESGDGRLPAAAATVRGVLARLDDALDDPPYNLVVHPDHHWHVHVWPRVAVVAGFEQGTGIWVNPVPPEQAAEVLRQGPSGPRSGPE